jgi:hypothetical protein
MTERGFAVVIALGLALAACSSDDDSSGTGGSAGSAGSSGSGGSAGSGATGGAGGGAGATADTWANFAQGFFATYCIECHGAGDALRDYTTIADVEVDQDSIRCGVSPTALSGCGTFPPPGQFPIDNAAGDNPKPGDDERARLVAWIEAGLPQ